MRRVAGPVARQFAAHARCVGAHDGRVGAPRSHGRRTHGQLRNTRVGRVVRHAVDDAVQDLRSARAPVFVFDAPCYPDNGAGLPLPERSDPKRIKAFNEILAQAAAGHPDVHLVKFHALVCPDGHRVESIHGTDLWQGDGVHLSDAGAVYVWRWLLPQIRDVVAAQQH